MAVHTPWDPDPCCAVKSCRQLRGYTHSVAVLTSVWRGADVDTIVEGLETHLDGRQICAAGPEPAFVLRRRPRVIRHHIQRVTSMLMVSWGRPV